MVFLKSKVALTIYNRKKRWLMYISPLEYHVNLAQPLTVQGKPSFRDICHCADDIVYASFEDFRTLLYVLMRVVKVFVR